MELKISEEYLDELMNYIGRKLCGTVMRRFDIVEDRNVLKSMIKDTIYEEMRHFKDLLYSAGAGLEISQFKFLKGNNKGE